MLNNEDLNYIKEQLSFWDRLSDNEKQLFVNNVEIVKYDKGENLHGGAKECLGLLLIKSGELRSYILSEEGRDITLYRLNEGDSCVLSASCIINNITFDVFIDAEQHSEVLLLNVMTLNRLAQDNIYVENFIYKKTVDRFSDVMWAMEQILFMSFDRRLAVFIYDEMVRTKSDKISFTHEQIAKYVGSAREVVSRMLKNFETRGILKLSRGTIEIVDKEKLKELL